jgi:hypothetical protein
MPQDAVDIALARIGSSTGTVVRGYIAADAKWPCIAPPRSTDSDEIDDAEARLFTMNRRGRRRRGLRAQGGGLDADGLGILLANLLGLEVLGSSEKRGVVLRTQWEHKCSACAQRRKSAGR